MTFTLHSHSGEFCPGHAKDKLEAILERALEMGFSVVGLTEHMPRVAVEDLYPEEVCQQSCQPAMLSSFDD